MGSCTRRLIWVLVVATFMLLVVAVAAGAVYLVMHRQQNVEKGWQDPVAVVAPAEIAPYLAVYPLAGSATLETVDVAINSNELETAYAMLVLTYDATDGQRIGRLVELGGAFARANKPQRASLAYQQIYDLAVLSPGLTDSVRGAALLAAGEGWAAVGKKDQASSSYGQAYLLSTASPYLQVTERVSLLTTLAGDYRKLGDQAQAEACTSEIATLDQNGSTVAQTVQPAPDLPVGENLVSTAEIGNLEEGRRQAAFALVQALAAGSEPPADLVTNLSQALQAEDAAKLGLYSQALEGTTESARRIDVHWQMIRWLTLKYQVAVKGFGLSLIPDWEGQATEVRSALAKEYENLFFDMEDLVSALPNASLIAPGRYDALRMLNLAGRLGQYPNYPADQMADKLSTAATDLIAARGASALYVDVKQQQDGLDFLFSPADQYGRSAAQP